MTESIKTIRIVRQGPAGPAGAAGIVQSVAGLTQATITGDELKDALAVVPGSDVQPYNANLASLAGLSLAADKLPYSIGPDTLALTDLTAAGRAMTGAASAAAQTALLSAFSGDAGAGGAKGLVPAPAAGDAAANKALFADGNWKPLGGLSVGATAVGGGTSARILYDNSGTLGEYSAAQAKSFLAIAQTDVAGLTASSDATFKSLTLAGGTITTNAPVVNATRTWNGGAVVFTADLINITDTASAAGSLLWDRQVGGVSKAKVDKSGNATFAGAINCGPITTGNGAAGNINAGGNTTMTLGSSFILSDNTGRFSAWNNAQVGWSANNPTNGSNDTYLTRAAAGVVAFNGTIQMASVPTADPHVAGRVWSNGGVLTVSAG